MKYTQVKDDNGHNYVIPVDRIDEWWDYIRDVSLFWSPWGDKNIHSEPIEPDWVERIDGGRLVFENWEII